MKQNLSKNLPHRIAVRVIKTPEGTFYARLPDFPGIFTEADDPLELIFQVNDAVFTFFDVPRKELRKEEVQYFPPEDYFKRLLELKERKASAPKSRAGTQVRGEFDLYIAA